MWQRERGPHRPWVTHPPGCAERGCKRVWSPTRLDRFAGEGNPSPQFIGCERPSYNNPAVDAGSNPVGNTHCGTVRPGLTPIDNEHQEHDERRACQPKLTLPGSTLTAR